jgi:hypothetical protein
MISPCGGTRGDGEKCANYFPKLSIASIPAAFINCSNRPKLNAAKHMSPSFPEKMSPVSEQKPSPMAVYRRLIGFADIVKNTAQNTA